MEELEEDNGFEVRVELMISANGGPMATKRLGHFLKPCINSIKGQVFELPTHCLSSLPPVFEPKNWPLNVNFHGWRAPQKEWTAWVEKMAALHECTWKKAGMHEAILNSTYEIRRNYDLVLGLAEKWCPETKSFIFSWGEATITLEDMMIAGYSVLGSPVFSPLETDELMETQDKLNEAVKELNRSIANKPEHGKWMTKFMDSGSEIEHEAFLSLWLSRFVFPSSNCIISRSVFPIAVKLARGSRIALAPAVLAGIYIDLSFLKEKIVALSLVDSWEDENRKLEINIWSPFQLVQIWAWERFKDLRPEPNLVMRGEPRFAQWHKLMVGNENVMMVLDSSRKCFDWRPYAKTLNNWKLPMFYGEKEIRVLVGGDLPEELQSWGQCLRISELVGLDCVEQYLPHRITRQFGMDQDLPACVAPANESPKSAWSSFCKPVTYAKLYIPSRHYEAGVTTRYLKWWKKSLLRLQSASNGALPQKRNLSRSKIIPKGSNGKRENSFPGFKRTPKKAKRMKEQDVAASTCSHFALKTLGRSPTISKRKNRDDDFSPALGCPPKKGRKLVELSKQNKTESASVELPSNRPPLGLEVKNDVNHVVTTDSTEEDSLTIAELINSRKKHDGFWDENVGNAENLPDQSVAFSSIAQCEVVKIIPPETELVKMIMKNVPVNFGSEKAVEDSTDGKVGSPAHDTVRIQNGEGDGNKCDCDMIERRGLHLEEWVTRLEAIVAKLKAEKFHSKSQL